MITDLNNVDRRKLSEANWSSIYLNKPNEYDGTTVSESQSRRHMMIKTQLVGGHETIQTFHKSMVWHTGKK